MFRFWLSSSCHPIPRHSPVEQQLDLLQPLGNGRQSRFDPARQQPRKLRIRAQHFEEPRGRNLLSLNNRFSDVAVFDAGFRKHRHFCYQAARGKSAVCFVPIRGAFTHGSAQYQQRPRSSFTAHEQRLTRAVSISGVQIYYGFERSGICACEYWKIRKQLDTAVMQHRHLTST